MSDVVQSDHDNIVEISPPSVKMKESISVSFTKARVLLLTRCL